MDNKRTKSGIVQKAIKGYLKLTSNNNDLFNFCWI
jgi:hypothetical protein